MKNLQNQPSTLVEQYSKLKKSDNEGERHKLLIDLGETFLKYLTDIMLGEYKKSEDIFKKLEIKLYKLYGKNLSLGIYQDLFRDLSKTVGNSIIAEKLSKGKKYELGSKFIYEFERINKNLIEGNDGGFTKDIVPNGKGTSIGQKGLLEFFDNFIRIRNIHAHPEEKAGPKDNKRKWPLGDEYYNFINPLLESALIEIINDFEVLQEYKPVFIKELDDKNKKGIFLLQVGEKETLMDRNLTIQRLSRISTDTRYLIDSQEEFYVKLYKSIPSVNATVAEEIKLEEKAKIFEPHLMEIIHSKLSDDGRIDEMEFLVLKDTADSAFISTEKLFELIDEVRGKLKIDATIGTPENKGNLFIETKNDAHKIGFNPRWLYYLSMVPKINKNKSIITEEKEKEKIINDKIAKLKEQKKTLPLVKRIDSNKVKIKAKKNSISDLKPSNTEKIKKKKAQIKKASNTETKEKYRNDLLEIEKGFEFKLNKYDNELNELNETLTSNEILLSEKKLEIDKKLETIESELESFKMMTQWGMHQNLWNEIGQYINQIIEDNINIKGSEKNDENDELEERSSTWANTPNQWQIGQLAYTYWGKIHPVQGPLGIAYNIGYAVSNKFQWVPIKNNIDESLWDALSKPSTLIWTTTDDKWVAKIDLDGSITQKRAELNMELIKKYEKEFLSMGVNVRCNLPNLSAVNAALHDKDIFMMPLEKFLQEKGKYIASGLFSRIWPIDSFYDKGQINLEALAQYEREMTTLITIFSNSLITLNEYALENGVNQDTIEERFDHFNRAQTYLSAEIQKKYPVGKKIEATKEEMDQWRIEMKDNFDLTDYLFDRAFEAVRWRISSNTDTEKPSIEESNDPKL